VTTTKLTTHRSMSLTHAAFTDLAAIRRFVANACADAHASPDARDSLELAVDEACTNVIEHGYPKTAPGPVGVTFEADDRELRVHLVDRGKPFPPDDAPLADTISGWVRRFPGGLGWHLIKNVVDSVTYATESDGSNRLTLVVVRRPS